MARPLTEQSQEELIAYITDVLRPELQQRREATEAVDKAFAAYDQPTRDAMLRLVGDVGRDPVAGARKLRALADDILGEDGPPPATETEEEDMTTPEATPDAAAGLGAVLEKIMERLDQMDARVQEVATHARNSEQEWAVNFARESGVPDEQLADFFQIAASDLADGDLAKAAEIFGKLYPKAEPEAAEAPAAESAPEPPRFPAPASAGGTPPPVADPTEPQNPATMSKAEWAAAVRQYMASTPRAGEVPVTP